ncbi:MAG: hypothetical protein CMP23_10530 [Rickettsiales bacterium]|nr:hypothetical protein [Rickettsiales bacterium]
MNRLVLLLLALLLLPGCLAGCNAEDDHYQRALAIERELLRQNPETDYSSPRYLHVMRALRRVPAGSPDRDRAVDLMQRISDARRIALNSALPKQVDHLPDRLANRQIGRPPTTDFSKVRPAADPLTAAAAASTAATAKTNAIKPAEGALQITMYSTSWCGYCSKARRWFTDNGIPFTEKDIEKDPEGAAEYQQASGGYGGVPLIVVNGKSFRGFDPRALLARIRELKGS